MHAESFFIQALVYLTAAVIAVPLAKRFGLGSVLGYLLAGVVIGPYVLGLVGDEKTDVMHFAEFGVVMMLFLVGLELEPALLWRLRNAILGMGGLQMAGTTSIVLLVSLLLGFHWKQGLALGLILGMSSTAIVLQSLSEKGWDRRQGGRSAFAVLLFQDIAVIPILALFPLLAVSGFAVDSGDSHGGGNGLPAWLQTLQVVGAVALVALGGRFIVQPAFWYIGRARLREIFTAAALLLVIAIAVLMQMVGLSPALGTFLAGVVLANSEYRHELESDLEPFKGILLGLFFIAVGASIQFPLIAAHPLETFLLVPGIMLLKAVVMLAVGKAFKLSTDQNLLFAFGLSQVGEFAFVLFSFSVQQHILPEETVSLLIAVTALSMALTPFVFLAYEHVILPRTHKKNAPGRDHDTIHEHNPVIIAGFGRFGNIIGRLLRANGIGCTVFDHNADRVDVLRNIGLDVYYGDASRYDMLLMAGAAHAKILIIALDGEEQNVEIVHMARKHFPNLRIFVRARDRADAYELKEAGADFVYRETFDTALRIGTEALTELGVRAYTATRSAQFFRKHDEHALEELAKHRKNRTSYLNLARDRIRELEQLLKQDGDSLGREKDEGWDVDSLREEIKKSGKLP